MERYFTERLAEYIEDAYFDLSEEDIQARVSSAMREYNSQIASGEHTDISKEFSSEVLYTGLIFSPIGYIKEILEWNLKFSEDTSLNFARGMYKKESILDFFEKHEVTDLFVGSCNEHLLVEDLILEINKYLNN